MHPALNRSPCGQMLRVQVSLGDRRDPGRAYASVTATVWDDFCRHHVGNGQDSCPCRLIDRSFHDGDIFAALWFASVRDMVVQAYVAPLPMKRNRVLKHWLVLWGRQVRQSLFGRTRSFRLYALVSTLFFPAGIPCDPSLAALNPGFDRHQRSATIMACRVPEPEGRDCFAEPYPTIEYRDQNSGVTILPKSVNGRGARLRFPANPLHMFPLHLICGRSPPLFAEG